MHILRSKKQHENFHTILDKIFLQFFMFQCNFTASEMELDYYQQKVNA